MRTPGTADADDVLLVDLSAHDDATAGGAAWDVDGDEPALPTGAPAHGPAARRSRRAWAGVAAGAVAVVLVLVGASELLRSPQERVEGRLADALQDAGVQLAEPVSLRDAVGEGVWTGRLRVLTPDGDVSGVRVAVRPDPADPAAAVPTAGLFPLVDCTTRYPLSWAGDSDTSFRTGRDDLAECVTASPGGGVLVTIAWRTDGDDDGAAGRQTWLTDARGGVVWLHNGSGDGRGGGSGLTGEQQRAVATAEGLLAPL
ncbi:hypothetical protein [Quadrisphaera sp. KR29]|uniref:hypothetical protein n=1 Tax=Quadrisphaera sp. KR29 TaxID=3461391 RepID=UPI004043F5CE